MRPTIKMLCGISAGALLLACNIDLSGANLQGSVNVDAKADKVEVNTGEGAPPGPPPGPSGIQEVNALWIEADSDTLVVGGLGVFDPERGYKGEPPNAGQPVPYPSPFAVADPVPFRSQGTNFRVFVVQREGDQPIQVPPDDPNFKYWFEPGIPLDFRPGERALYPIKDTPVGDLIFRVAWRDQIHAKKVFRIISPGVAEVVAE